MTEQAQRAPAGLGPAGRKLWRSVVERWVVDPREEQLLGEACRQADDNSRLAEVVASSPTMVTGSTGQQRVHPAIGELRQGRVVLEKLLASLSLPPDEGEYRVSRRQQLRRQRQG